MRRGLRDGQQRASGPTSKRQLQWNLNPFSESGSSDNDIAVPNIIPTGAPSPRSQRRRFPLLVMDWSFPLYDHGGPSLSRHVFIASIRLRPASAKTSASPGDQLQTEYPRLNHGSRSAKRRERSVDAAPTHSRKGPVLPVRQGSHRKVCFSCSRVA
jgi:hypothetical protein